MLEVTPRAAQMVADQFEGKERRPIRIFVRLGGCGIRTFGIALGTAAKTDQVFNIEGFDYIINKKLLNMVRPIKFDTDGISYRLSGTGVPPPNGCGNCANMCGVRGGRRCPGECATCDLQCGQGRRARKAAQPARRIHGRKSA